MVSLCAGEDTVNRPDIFGCGCETSMPSWIIYSGDAVILPNGCYPSLDDNDLSLIRHLPRNTTDEFTLRIISPRQVSTGVSFPGPALRTSVQMADGYMSIVGRGK